MRERREKSERDARKENVNQLKRAESEARKADRAAADQSAAAVADERMALMDDHASTDATPSFSADLDAAQKALKYGAECKRSAGLFSTVKSFIIWDGLHVYQCDEKDHVFSFYKNKDDSQYPYKRQGYITKESLRLAKWRDGQKGSKNAKVDILFSDDRTGKATAQTVTGLSRDAWKALREFIRAEEKDFDKPYEHSKHYEKTGRDQAIELEQERKKQAQTRDEPEGS